jgi:peptidoglycan/LPS O-acetylase OafA/YrhL
MNMFGFVAGLENAFLLGLLALGLMRRGVGWMSQPVLLWAAATLCIWAAVYGFVSYQNLGTAFRWRSQVTPVLLLLGMYLAFSHHLRPGTSAIIRRWRTTHRALPPEDEIEQGRAPS